MTHNKFFDTTGGTRYSEHFYKEVPVHWFKKDRTIFMLWCVPSA